MNVRTRAMVAATAFLLCCVLFSNSRTNGQAAKPSDFKKEPPNAGSVRSNVIDMRDGKRIVKNPPEEKANQEAMNLMAKSLIYPITDSKYYFPVENTKGDLKPAVYAESIHQQLDNFERFILLPYLTPALNSRLNVDQADYIKGFGVAVDAALKDVISPDMPPYIRLNAARVLAIAAKSGAPAHYPMILAMLNDPNTAPEVLIYVIRAAEGLISAYEAIPRSTGATAYALHTLKDAEMVQLVTALETIIARNQPYGKQPKAVQPVAPVAPPVDPKAPAAKPAAPAPAAGQLQSNPLTPEQAVTIRFYRRAAIRALAQCRYPQFVDPANSKTVRPLMTLAKIAVMDTSLNFVPMADESGEAVIGLANIHDPKGLNVDVQLDAIATGIYHFAVIKAASNTDKSIQWKMYAARIATALADWQKTPSATRNAQKIGSLVTVATDKLLTPIEKLSSGIGQSAPNLDSIVSWKKDRPVTVPQLFIDVKESVLNPANRSN